MTASIRHLHLVSTDTDTGRRDIPDARKPVDLTKRIRAAAKTQATCGHLGAYIPIRSEDNKTTTLTCRLCVLRIAETGGVTRLGPPDGGDAA